MEEIGDNQGITVTYNIIGAIYQEQGNFTEALKFHTLALKLGEENGDKLLQANSFANIGNVYGRQGYYPKALEYHMAGLKILEEIGNKLDIAKSYGNIGNIKALQGYYPEALEYFLIALRTFEEAGDKKSISKSYNNIGNIYQAMGDYTDALNNYYSALKISEEMGNKPGMAISHSLIGTVYLDLENYPEALANFKECKAICEETGDKNLMTSAFLNMGMIYEDQDDLPGALNSYLTALKISEEIGNPSIIATAYTWIGAAYRKTGDYNKARKYLEQGLLLLLGLGLKYEIQEAYSYLTALDSAEGNFSQALEHHKMYTLYKDSLLNEETYNQTSRLKIQYETEKKDREIEILNKENEIKSLQLAKQRIVRNGMIIGMILLVLLGILLFRSFRLKKKLEKQGAIIQERNRISADLHDDIGTGLSKISLLSEMVRSAAKTPEVKKEAEKIADTSKELLQSIGEIIWALNANNDHLENLVAYIRRYAAEYLENSEVKLKINAPSTIPQSPISGESRRNIFFSVKEALHNIIKHAEASMAEVNFSVENRELTVVIRDNGNGIPEGDLNRFGNGIRNMINRMQKINGKFKIENDCGTKITLSLPM